MAITDKIAVAKRINELLTNIIRLGTFKLKYRIVVDFAEPDAFLAVQNIGNSGVPGSIHYRDQFEPWLRGTYHVVHLDRDKLERATTTLILPA